MSCLEIRYYQRPDLLAVIETFLISAKNIPLELAFLESHSVLFVSAIHKLEERGLSLNDHIKLIEEISKKIDKVPGEKGKVLKEKTRTMFTNNLGYAKLKLINKAVVRGSISEEMNDLVKNPNLLTSYVYDCTS